MIARAGLAALLFVAAGPACAPPSPRKPVDPSLSYCMTDATIPFPTGGAVRAFVPCREADRIRKSKWRI